MAPYRVDFDSIPWEFPIKGLRCKTLQQGDRQLRLVEYTRDMEPHWCEKGHTGYVLEGQIEIRFERETVLYNPGDGIFIPHGSEHRHMGKAVSRVVRVIFFEDV
jgi:ethanolamine utilization protein EutQ (cupin superfamily)